jgi:hypothetical protein
VNGLGGCGCSGKIESLGSYSGFVPGSTSGFGLNPDGLGEAAWQPQWAAAGVGLSPDGLGAIDFGSVTGNQFFDAAVVAGIGYFVSPSDKDRKMWAAAGAAAGGLLGTVGLIAIVGFAMYSRKG